MTLSGKCREIDIEGIFVVKILTDAPNNHRRDPKKGFL